MSRSKAFSFIATAITAIVLGITFNFLGLAYGYVPKNAIPVSLDQLSPRDLKNNLVVEGDIPFTYGAFAEENEISIFGSNPINDYYLIDFGDYGYISIKEHANSHGQMYSLYEESSEYLSKNNKTPPSPVHVKGVLREQEPMLYGTMNRALLSMGYSKKEVKEISYGYVIIQESETNPFFIILARVAFGIAAISIIALIVMIFLQKDKDKLSAQQIRDEISGSKNTKEDLDIDSYITMDMGIGMDSDPDTDIIYNNPDN